MKNSELKYVTSFVEGGVYLVDDTFSIKKCVYRDGWFDVGYAKLKATSARVRLVSYKK